MAMPRVHTDHALTWRQVSDKSLVPRVLSLLNIAPAMNAVLVSVRCT